MTLIVASLYLPYTVAFQAGPDLSSDDSGHSRKRSSIPGLPVDNSIVDSLTKLAVKNSEFKTVVPKSVQDFKAPSQSIVDKKKRIVAQGAKTASSVSQRDLSISASLGAARAGMGSSGSANPYESVGGRPNSERSNGERSRPTDISTKSSNINSSIYSTEINPATSRLRSDRPRTHSISTHRSPHRPSQYGKQFFSRAPFDAEPFTQGNGGLRNAVARCVAEGSVTDHLWVGTLGMPTDLLDDERKREIAQRLGAQNCEPVFVSDATFEGHYNNYCKGILWPTFHYDMPQDGNSKAYEDHSWQHYSALNQAVADSIVERYQPGDVVWVNDYHLLLVCSMVRQRLPEAKIGLFIHVSFPSSEIFRCLARRKTLLDGMLGADCIGFQMDDYARHFLQTCNRILAVDTTPLGVRNEDRYTRVVSCPIGIDPIKLDANLTNQAFAQFRQSFRDRWVRPGQKLVVARDKMDHIRGLKQKLLGYEEFLKRYPEWIGKVALIQICLRGVNDAELESELGPIVDRINGMASDLTSEPVTLLQQDIGFQEYLALLTEGDVFVTTPLREGMNLTCHEFIYCNDRSKNGGALILSEFTGAASVVGSRSLLVNPWDKSQLADAFFRALTMSEGDRKSRSRWLYDHVKNNDCSKWLRDFVGAVEDACLDSAQRMKNSLHRLDLGRAISEYARIKPPASRLFFINLDVVSGQDHKTLLTSPGVSSFDEDSAGYLDRPPTDRSARMAALNHIPRVSPQRKITVLSELLADPRNIVYVISADSRAILEQMLQRLPSVGLVAENGGYVRPYSCSSSPNPWLELVQPGASRNWQTMVSGVLHSLAQRLPGSWIECNECSLFFHANIDSDVQDDDDENPDLDRTQNLMGEVINHINDAFGNLNIWARLTDNDNIVVASTEVSKTAAVKLAYGLCPGQKGYMFVAGGNTGDASDGLGDDELFEWAEAQAQANPDLHVLTVSTGGTVGTRARWAMQGVNAVLNALLGMAHCSISGE